MNLRQHKRITVSRMHLALFGAFGPIGQHLVFSFGIEGKKSLVQVFREAAGIDRRGAEALLKAIAEGSDDSVRTG